MNVKIANSFINALLEKLIKTMNWKVSVSKPHGTQTLFPALKASIHYGINGDNSGSIIISLEDAVAKSIASALNLNIEIKDLNGIARYGLEQFGDAILDDALFRVATLGYNVYSTPATIVIGDNVFISAGLIQTIVITVTTPVGLILLNIGLKEKKWEE